MRPIVDFLLYQTGPSVLHEILDDAVWAPPSIDARVYRQVWLDQIDGSVLVCYLPEISTINVYGFDLQFTNTFRRFEHVLDLPPSIEIRGNMPGTRPRPRRDPRLRNRARSYASLPSREHGAATSTRHGLPDAPQASIELVLLVPEEYPVHFTAGSYNVARMGRAGDISHRHAQVAFVD